MNKVIKQILYVRGWLFPSYAEYQFHDIMGWRYFWYGFKFQTKQSGYVIDFTTRYAGRKVAIEIDGARYHGGPDIVRDMVLYKAGWSVLHIPAKFLSNPKYIRRQIRQFIKDSPKV